MKNLFLIDGASGTGKSDLLKWVTENNADDVGLVRKGTTRTQRDYEKADPEILLDLEFLSSQQFLDRNFEYAYTYGGFQYGLSQSEVTREVVRRDNVFVIVRNTDLIRRIADDYHFMNVVPVFIYTDAAELHKRLAAANTDSATISFRLERSELALRQYYAGPEAYHEVLINNSSRETFHNTINRLMAKYRPQPAINPYSIAVMMSYNPSNQKLDDYYDAMKAAVADVWPLYHCERIDGQPGSPKIAKEFRRLIRNARCVILDLTENKQNVYYELGYIHATQKTCIITAENGTQPSFYPREHKIIFYGSARDLREKLFRELQGVLSEIPHLTEKRSTTAMP